MGGWGGGRGSLPFGRPLKNTESENKSSFKILRRESPGGNQKDPKGKGVEMETDHDYATRQLAEKSHVGHIQRKKIWGRKNVFEDSDKAGRMKIGILKHRRICGSLR